LHEPLDAAVMLYPQHSLWLEFSGRGDGRAQTRWIRGKSALCIPKV